MPIIGGSIVAVSDTKTAAAHLEKARTCMERIAAMPDRVRSYFSHEYVRYAQ